MVVIPFTFLQHLSLCILKVHVEIKDNVTTLYFFHTCYQSESQYGATGRSSVQRALSIWTGQHHTGGKICLFDCSSAQPWTAQTP